MLLRGSYSGAVSIPIKELEAKSASLPSDIDIKKKLANSLRIIYGLSSQSDQKELFLEPKLLFH
jgi:hypothetical protein